MVGRDWMYQFPPIVPGLSGEQRDLITQGRAALAAAIHAAWDRGDLPRVMDLVGNEERPVIVFEWFALGVEPDQLAPCVLDAWTHGHRHHGTIPAESWLELFDFVGFVSDPPRPRPAIVEAWRGQPLGAPVGMCWSRDPAMAEWFRDRWEDRGVPAEVLHAVIPGGALLGMCDARGESEVVVDVRTLGSVWVVD